MGVRTRSYEEIAMWRAMTTMVLASALALGACGEEGPAPPAATGAPTISTTTTPATTAPTVAEDACDPQIILDILKRQFDGTAPKLRIVRADVKRCRGRYAQVFAIPDQSVCRPGVGYCYDSEQVFLRLVDGTWRIVASGTGITCRGETNAEVRRICRALGYPG
jgi:hypothetical protein